MHLLHSIHNLKYIHFIDHWCIHTKANWHRFISVDVENSGLQASFDWHRHQVATRQISASDHFIGVV